jgi:hypothetical protein
MAQAARRDSTSQGIVSGNPVGQVVNSVTRKTVNRYQTMTGVKRPAMPAALSAADFADAPYTTRDAL